MKKKLSNLAIPLLFIVYVSSCELENPSSITLDEIIKIESAATEIFANGVSTVTITATLEGETPNGETITLKTDNGTFVGQEPNSSNNNGTELSIKAAPRLIQADLKSSTEVGEVTISATVGEYIAFTKVNFTRENPNRIFLESSATTLRANGNDAITLTANLIAPQDGNGQIGTVSQGTRVLFLAKLDSTGSDLLALRRESLSNSSGKATAQLVGRTTGLVRIIATVENLPQVRDSIYVDFVDE
ncbi:MAG: hypothetical protein ACMZ7B_10925 [Balneola sp.]